MSDEAQRPLDMRAILTRIDRDLAESAKLRAESEKFVAEQRKLIAAERELTCDRWLAPALAIAAVIGDLLGVATFITHLMGH